MAPLYSIFFACLLAYAVPRRGKADCVGPNETAILDVKLTSTPNATFPLGWPVYFDEVAFRCKQCPAQFNDVIDAVEEHVGPHFADDVITRLQAVIDGHCCEEEEVGTGVAVFGPEKEEETVVKVVPEVRNEQFVNAPAPLGFPDMTLREILAGHRFRKDDPATTCPTHQSIEEVFADDILRADGPVYEVGFAKPASKKVRGIDVLHRFVRKLIEFWIRLWCAIAICTMLVIYSTYIWLCALMLINGGLPGHRVIEIDAPPCHNVPILSATTTESYDADDEQTEQTGSVEGASSEIDVTMDDVSQSHA